MNLDKRGLPPRRSYRERRTELMPHESPTSLGRPVVIVAVVLVVAWLLLVLLGCSGGDTTTGDTTTGVTTTGVTQAYGIRMKPIFTDKIFFDMGVICTFPMEDSTLVPVVHVFFRDADGFELLPLNEWANWVSKQDRPESFEWADGVWTYTRTYSFRLAVGKQIKRATFKSGHEEGDNTNGKD